MESDFNIDLLEDDAASEQQGKKLTNRLGKSLAVSYAENEVMRVVGNIKTSRIFLLRLFKLWRIDYMT